MTADAKSVSFKSLLPFGQPHLLISLERVWYYLEKRQVESQRLRAKYPDHILVCNRVIACVSHHFVAGHR